MKWFKKKTTGNEMIHVVIEKSPDMPSQNAQHSPARVFMSIERKFGSASTGGYIPQFENVSLSVGLSRDVGDVDMGAASQKETLAEAQVSIFNKIRAWMNAEALELGIGVKGKKLGPDT